MWDTKTILFEHNMQSSHKEHPQVAASTSGEALAETWHISTTHTCLYTHVQSHINCLQSVANMNSKADDCSPLSRVSRLDSQCLRLELHRKAGALCACDSDLDSVPSQKLGCVSFGLGPSEIARLLPIRKWSATIPAWASLGLDLGLLSLRGGS